MLILILMSGTSAHADGTRKLTAGKNYRLDLNGGKKETIKVTLSETKNNHYGEWYGKWKIYINKKMVESYTISDIDHSIEIIYLDINQSDKFHEIMIKSIGNNLWLDDLRIIRYYKQGKVEVIKLKKNTYPFSPSRLDFIANDGNNHLTFLLDTPFYNAYFGLYNCMVDAEVKNEEICYLSSDTYELKVPNLVLPLYKLNRSMNLYNDPSETNRIGSLVRGTQFTALSIKPVDPLPGSFPGTHWGMFVKIAAQTGENGWLFFPNSATVSHTGSSYYNRFLDYVPGWG